jgi:hypothetical protein
VFALVVVAQPTILGLARLRAMIRESSPETCVSDLIRLLCDSLHKRGNELGGG